MYALNVGEEIPLTLSEFTEMVGAQLSCSTYSYQDGGVEITWDLPDRLLVADFYPGYGVEGVLFSMAMKVGE